MSAGLAHHSLLLHTSSPLLSESGEREEGGVLVFSCPVWPFEHPGWSPTSQAASASWGWGEVEGGTTILAGGGMWGRQSGQQITSGRHRSETRLGTE